MRKSLPFLFCLLLLPIVAAANEPRNLHQLFEEEWQWQLRDDPESATWLGERGHDDRLTDRSPAAWQKRRDHDRDLLARIRRIDRTKLSADDQLNYDLFLLQAQLAVEGDQFPYEVLPVNQMDGVHTLLGDLAQQIPRDTVKDHENFLARMRAFPRAVDETIALMKRGAAAGVVPPKVVVREVAAGIASQVADDPAKSPIYELAFTNFRPSIPAAEQERLQKEALQILRDQVFPAMRKLHTFWIAEYEPKTRQEVGWTTVPQGKEWYPYLVRQQTTTTLTPEEIHTLGLSEVKRIRAAMEKVKGEAGFEGSLADFFKFLRSDPRFYYTTRNDLLVGYRDIAKRIDPELTRLFGRIPRQPYGVIPIPAYAEKTQTTAYYSPGSLQSHRPGYYFVNLYDLASRPKWEMEALSLHEAVPGHHFQIALAQELDQLPRFRRNGGFTAFVEGWGLYAESLGPELGMYGDPYSRFGQLTYEMWRAVRLVVDTGMHAKGWSRQQAIDYFVANSSKPLHDIEVEIDRYLVWPGQALAYKLGELKIKELRARAQQELGERFDVRAFHDAVLGAGPLPLSVLDARMNDWISSRKAAPAPAR